MRLCYIPVVFLAQIQASHTGEIPIQHDEKKNPYLHTEKYGSKYCINDVVHERTTFILFPNFIFTQHKAGGECEFSLVLKAHVCFQ